MDDPKKALGPLAGSLPVKPVKPKTKRVNASGSTVSRPGKKPVRASALQEIRLQARTLKGGAKGQHSGALKIVTKTSAGHFLKPLRHVEALEAVRSGLMTDA